MTKLYSIKHQLHTRDLMEYVAIRWSPFRMLVAWSPIGRQPASSLGQQTMTWPGGRYGNGYWLRAAAMQCPATRIPSNPHPQTTMRRPMMIFDLHRLMPSNKFGARSIHATKCHAIGIWATRHERGFRRNRVLIYPLISSVSQACILKKFGVARPDSISQKTTKHVNQWFVSKDIQICS